MSLLQINDEKTLQEISNDEELNVFFTKITNHYNIICETKKVEAKEKLQKEKPKLEEWETLIESIEKTGIKIEGIPDYKKRLSEKPPFYHNPSYTGLSSLLSFDGVKLTPDDIIYITEHGDNLEPKLAYLELSYNSLKKENKNIEKKISKLEKICLTSSNSIYEQMEYDKKLKELKNTLNLMKNIETRISFIKNQTMEQRKLLADFLNVSKSLFFSYQSYSRKKSNLSKALKKEQKNNIKEAYEEVMDNSLVMIDIDRIIKKLFKILLKSELEELKDVYIKTEESVKEEKTRSLTIDEEVINWFITENKDKVLELFNYVFDDVEEISETLNTKILKKQI